MKTVVVQCIFTIEVPWDPDWGGEDALRFRIEENSCPGTGPVDGALSALMEAAEANSCCWACRLGGENKVLEILDREPVDYASEYGIAKP